MYCVHCIDIWIHEFVSARPADGCKTKQAKKAQVKGPQTRQGPHRDLGTLTQVFS